MASILSDLETTARENANENQIIEVEETPHTSDSLQVALPTEAVIEILSYLTLTELATVSRLNSSYLILAQDDMLWKRQCLRWGILNVHVSWQEAFKRTVQDQQLATEQAKNRKKYSATKQVFSSNRYRFQRGEHLLIKSRPCKVMEVLFAKPGRHGRMRLRIEGTDVFTGEDRYAIYPHPYQRQPATVNRAEYLVERMDIKEQEKEEGSTLQLIHTTAKEIQRTIKLPEGELGEKLRQLCALRNVRIIVAVVDAHWQHEETLEEIIEEAIVEVVSAEYNL